MWREMNKFAIAWLMIASSAGSSKQLIYPEIGVGMLSYGKEGQIG